MNHPDNPKILSYAQTIVSSKQNALAKLEETLNSESIIDDKYNFNVKRGNKQKLAAFILKLQIGDFAVHSLAEDLEFKFKQLGYSDARIVRENIIINR